MPRNVRPSWCELSVDNTGNAPSVVKATGPKSRSGSLSATFKVRDKGEVFAALQVDIIGSGDGKSVRLVVTDCHGGLLHERGFIQ